MLHFPDETASYGSWCRSRKSTHLRCSLYLWACNGTHMPPQFKSHSSVGVWYSGKKSNAGWASSTGFSFALVIVWLTRTPISLLCLPQEMITIYTSKNFIWFCMKCINLHTVYSACCVYRTVTPIPFGTNTLTVTALYATRWGLVRVAVLCATSELAFCGWTGADVKPRKLL